MAARRQRTKNWTPSLDLVFVRILLEHHTRGNFQGGSFTNRSWSEIVGSFDRETHLKYDKAKLHNRWKHLKETFRLYHSLMSKSGWGMDPISKCAVAPNESTWLELPEKLRKLRGVPFLVYDDVNTIVGRDIATGVEASSTRQAPTLDEEDTTVTETQQTDGVPDDTYNYFSTYGSYTEMLSSMHNTQHSTSERNFQFSQQSTDTTPDRFANVPTGDGTPSEDIRPSPQPRPSKGTSSDSSNKRKSASSQGGLSEAALDRVHELLEEVVKMRKEPFPPQRPYDHSDDIRNCMEQVKERVPSLDGKSEYTLLKYFSKPRNRAIFAQVVDSPHTFAAWLDDVLTA